MTPLRTCAHPDCPGCAGGGVSLGFGSAGQECSCVCECSVCRFPIPIADYDEGEPRRVDEGSACVRCWRERLVDTRLDAESRAFDAAQPPKSTLVEQLERITRAMIDERVAHAAAVSQALAAAQRLMRALDLCTEVLAECIKHTSDVRVCRRILQAVQAARAALDAGAAS